ncbi:MAG: glycosyltransferase [Chloracidobacterium sp.]|nr:glycosyltransferase [Chloracidobacterium sp.]
MPRTELSGRDIICFSHDWSGDPLSKTHLIRVLSRDNRILWVNAIANRAPTASTKDLSRIYRKLASFTKPVVEVEPNIYVLNPLAVPAYGNQAVRKFNERFLVSQVRRTLRRLGFKRPLNLVFNPAAGLVAGKLGEDGIIYYCVDEYTAFTGASKGLKEIEEKLFGDADLVIVSAEELLRSKKKFNENTHLIRHGTDWAHFRRALEPATEIPPEIDALPRPIIGFHGLLADWVDYPLIKKLAERFRDGSVVLIGKIAVDAEEKIRVLEGIENVHFLGRKPYSELPAYCKGFDVAINPFVINELTLAANPLKVREYLAAGVPVVSTDIPEVRVLEHCHVGRDDEDFIVRVEQQITSANDRQIISDSIRGESWEAKVEELKGLLENWGERQAD